MPRAISRRRLLGTATATLGGILAPALPPRGAAQAAAATTLTAGRRTLEVKGRAASVFAITGADGAPGLVTDVGTPFQVTLRNDAGADTLIHWHGLTPPYRQDGVPDISAPVVAPGGTAQYDFPLTFPGTFWMHSHQGLQEQSLMSAPLIVHDRGAPADRQEVVLMLHDFAFRSPEEIYAGLRARAATGMGQMPGMAMGGMAMGGMAMGAPPPAAGMKMDLNDVTYDAFLANDRTLDDPLVVRVEKRGRILLRIINGSASSNFVVDLGRATASLVAVDGHAVQPITGSAFPLAIAQRIDLELALAADQTVLPVFAVLEGERTRTGIVLATAGGPVAKLAALADQASAALDLTLEQRLRARAPLPPRKADRTHQVALTGDMQAYTWGLNGLAYGEDKPLMVAKDQRVELVMTNKTMMAHPMHLHGHVFQVVAVGGRRFAGALRDTVLVPPMQSVTVAFDADNPGRWAFHCHNMYHMEAGMFTTVQYDVF